MNPKLYEAFKYHRSMCGWVGHAAEGGLRMARAELWALSESVKFEWEECGEEWDGDCPAPDVLLECIARHPSGERTTLCSVGLNSWSDPYMRSVEAELAYELREQVEAQRENDAIKVWRSKVADAAIEWAAGERSNLELREVVAKGAKS